MAYPQMNRCKEVAKLFDRTVAFQVKFDDVASVSMLSACAQLGEIEKGRMVHECIEKKGIRTDSYLRTSLSNCGSI